MKITLDELRTVIHEVASARLIRVGPVMGSFDRGTNVRVTKGWHALDDQRAWRQLRNVLAHVSASDAWRDRELSGSHDEHFIDVDLRSRDEESAELERQALIGDLERAGFIVDARSARRSTMHPYR